MKKKFYLLLGSFLLLAGVMLTALTYVSTFRRVPPDAQTPVFTLDWEFEGLNQHASDVQKGQKETDTGQNKNTRPLKAVFILEIPAIKVKETVYEGTSKRTLMSGPGHITSTAYPGEKGNCVVSGHRVTYGGPFRNLHRVEKGDEIIVKFRGKIFSYRVVWIKRVHPEDVWVAAPTELPSLTLTTCDPPYSAKYRLVVRAVMLEKK